MRIQYWAAARIMNNVINFSVTGEGSIEIECRQDAEQKAAEINPLAKIVDLQQVAIISL